MQKALEKALCTIYPHLRLEDIHLPIAVEEHIVNVVRESLNHLDDKTADVLTRYFGINYREHTYEEAAAACGISKGSAHRLAVGGIRNLQNGSLGHLLRVCLLEEGILDVSNVFDPRVLYNILQKVESGEVISDAELSLIPIKEIDFSTRTCNRLVDNHIETMLDVKRLRRGLILRYENAGKMTLEEIEDVLSKFGHTLC